MGFNPSLNHPDYDKGYQSIEQLPNGLWLRQPIMYYWQLAYRRTSAPFALIHRGVKSKRGKRTENDYYTVQLHYSSCSVTVHTPNIYQAIARALPLLVENLNTLTEELSAYYGHDSTAKTDTHGVRAKVYKRGSYRSGVAV